MNQKRKPLYLAFCDWGEYILSHSCLSIDREHPNRLIELCLKSPIVQLHPLNHKEKTWPSFREMKYIKKPVIVDVILWDGGE